VKQRGFALAMVLAVLALGSMLVIPSLYLASTGTKATQHAKSQLLELYTADAGVEHAIWSIRMRVPQIPSFGSPPWTYSLAGINGKTADVSIEAVGDLIYKITSTATTPPGSATVIEAFISTPVFLFDGAIAALNGDITLGGNSWVYSSPDPGQGDIYANGNISLTKNVVVNGDVSATGVIDAAATVTITGTQAPNSEPISLPLVDTSVYLAQANLGTLIDGDLSLSGTVPYYLGPARITGNLTLSGKQKLVLTGTLWVDGTVSMSGQAQVEGPYNVVSPNSMTVTGQTKLDVGMIPCFISTNGSITAAGNGWISAVLYAPNGAVTLSGNSQVYGAVVADRVSGGGNNFVEFPTNLRSDRPGLPGGDVARLSWKITVS
jgi:hypothetical protein